MSRVQLVFGKSYFSLFHKLFLFVMLFSLLTSCESKSIIVNGLDEKEANEILVFLASKNIDATKVQVASEGGGGGGKGLMWNISVSTARANEAMAYLNQAGLPRRRGQNLLGIFSNVGLVPSGMQEKIRFQAGLAEQIASTIRKIDGVLDAEVNLSFPEEDPLNPGAPKQKVTASVYVRHSGVLDDPNSHLVTRIKKLVAGSVANLDYDHVTVVGDKAKLGEYTNAVPEEERPFVNVWSLVIAKESLFRFRMVFFSFTIILLVLLLSALWFLWKLMPFIHKAGGIKSLFSIHPLDTLAEQETAKTEVKEAEKTEEAAAEPAVKEEQGTPPKII